MIVEQIIKDGATLIDVRDEIELVADGEVEGAIHIPLSEIADRIEEIQELPQPIVFFCRSGGRAQSAVNFCKEQGIENVHNGGGFQEVNQNLKS